MSRIRVLSDLLVNKIAAGEVIERPASVAKELLENAVDAGATRIDLTLEDGGKRLVQVADDGAGMAADDLALAVEPHATSKIAHEDDLFAIGTMGFRGEALASIGSVSHLKIVSRVPEEPGGHEIAVTGSRIEGPMPVAAPPGTVVEVRDLFCNVPARRKFLRTTNTEMSHLGEQLVRIAMAHPHVHLTCTHNGRTTHDLPAHGGEDLAQALRRRIADLFSPELADAVIGIDRRERGLHLHGWVAPPAHTRGTANWQYTWLNGRYIRDRFIQHAVREAYRGLLPDRRFPVVFLFLQMNPSDVDVNVHPTKIEVRFRDSNLVHSQVLAALRETFLTRDLTPTLGGGVLGDGSEEGGDSPHGPGPHGGSSPAGDAASTRKLPTSGGQAPREVAHGGGRAATDPAREAEMRQALTAFLKQAAPVGPDAEPPLPDSRWAADGPAEDASAGERRDKGLQIHNTYLVAETEDGLIIVDQHALHERIIYQQLVDRVSQGRLESQRLLLPETLDVTPADLACLETFGELLARLGLEITPFGPTTVAVQAVPSVLNDVDAADWVRQLLSRLADKPDQAVTDEFIHELLDMMACKAAVKAGDPLTPGEIESLLSRRTAIEKGSACPHGRPTTLRMTIRDLEKQFKRT